MSFRAAKSYKILQVLQQHENAADRKTWLKGNTSDFLPLDGLSFNERVEKVWVKRMESTVGLGEINNRHWSKPTKMELKAFRHAFAIHLLSGLQAIPHLGIIRCLFAMSKIFVATA